MTDDQLKELIELGEKVTNLHSAMAAEILRLRDALRKYAAHDNWDRLATYCNYLEFDAPGDFENGWELAEEALKEGE